MEKQIRRKIVKFSGKDYHIFWSPLDKTYRLLAKITSDHPNFPAGTMVRTSPIVEFRTKNTIYRMEEK